jgi:formamidopyrimidine-DNA glycosylase
VYGVEYLKVFTDSGTAVNIFDLDRTPNLRHWFPILQSGQSHRRSTFFLVVILLTLTFLPIIYCFRPQIIDWSLVRAGIGLEKGVLKKALALLYVYLRIIPVESYSSPRLVNVGPFNLWVGTPCWQPASSPSYLDALPLKFKKKHKILRTIKAQNKIYLHFIYLNRMPELPEVEAARRVLERECLGKRIVGVEASQDDKVFQGVSPDQLRDTLMGHTTVSAKRKGKYCWLEFEPGAKVALLLHFGMTGGVAVKGKAGPQYQRYSINCAEDDWPPRFTKLQVCLDDGTEWAYCDSRRFGRVKLLHLDNVDEASVECQPPISALGWDPLLSMPSLEEFMASLSKQRRAIKALLLDQSFSAGIGNWVADEVLYQSRIHPEQPANSLTTDQAHRLHQSIHHVCTTASDAGADSSSFPEDWLFHCRWSKRSSSKSLLHGHQVDHITVGGRTSAYVPAVQKLIKQTSSRQPNNKKRQRKDANATAAAAAAAAAAATATLSRPAKLL